MGAESVSGQEREARARATTGCECERGVVRDARAKWAHLGLGCMRAVSASNRAAIHLCPIDQTVRADGASADVVRARRGHQAARRRLHYDRLVAILEF